MMVDVVTYLFNFLAERFKHKVQQQDCRSTMRARDVRLYRLYLELLPPLISVTTLVIVTVIGLRKAIQTLREPPQQQPVQPDLKIMLIFSSMNLLLDFLNVGCFARVEQVQGLAALKAHHDDVSHDLNLAVDDTDRMMQECDWDPDDHPPQTNHVQWVPSETTQLLLPSKELDKRNAAVDHVDDTDDQCSTVSVDTDVAGGLNLNMCSAWTHVCADTLRSVAVLTSATLATVFPSSTLTPADADSWAAVVVSIIILISLGPLVEGLYLTALKIYHMYHEPEQPLQEKQQHLTQQPEHHHYHNSAGHHHHHHHHSGCDHHHYHSAASPPPSFNKADNSILKTV